VTFRSILCPVDFSEQSKHALRWAVAVAARYDSRLTVFTVVDPLLAEAATVRLNRDLTNGETEPALREFAADVVPGGWTSRLSYDVRLGHAGDAILEAAEREGADLIVMGTQGLGGVRKLLLGSTTERVLRRTRTPVLAVPPHAAHPVAADAGARLDLGRILAATDFSDASLNAVHWAAGLARDNAVPMVMTHIVGALHAPPKWDGLVAESDEARVAEARQQLERLSRPFCEPGPCEVVVSLGRPAEAIASTAEERKAGLIVMGLTSESGPWSPRPGSIAYRVLCVTNVPVLIVPPQPAWPASPSGSASS
jgi:nucleotide-binding universal stress UspA family protein